VQIDVHGINAEIARTDPPDNGVEIGPVAVEIGSGRMGQPGDFDNIPLEQATGIRIGDHDGGHIIRQLGFQIGQVNPAIRCLGNLSDGITHKSGRCRIGTMG